MTIEEDEFTEIVEAVGAPLRLIAILWRLWARSDQELVVRYMLGGRYPLLRSLDFLRLPHSLYWHGGSCFR